MKGWRRLSHVSERASTRDCLSSGGQNRFFSVFLLQCKAESGFLSFQTDTWAQSQNKLYLSFSVSWNKSMLTSLLDSKKCRVLSGLFGSCWQCRHELCLLQCPSGTFHKWSRFRLCYTSKRLLSLTLPNLHGKEVRSFPSTVPYLCHSYSCTGLMWACSRWCCFVRSMAEALLWSAQVLSSSVFVYLFACYFCYIKLSRVMNSSFERLLIILSETLHNCLADW